MKIFERFKKLLYLLQLEEYQSKRYFCWLENNDIGQLREIKGKLKWTQRTTLTAILAFPVSLILGKKQAVGWTNIFLSFLFELIEAIIVLLARIKLKFYPRLIRIVITGSYGKTTFKEMLAWVLEAKYSVLKTTGNINTPIGIARLILRRLNSRYQVLIVEAGAYRPGEIAAVCRLVKPTLGVITIIGYMHLERFGSVRKIRQTKMELTHFVKNKEQLFYPSKNHQFIDFRKTVVKIARNLDMSLLEIKQRLSSFSSPQHRLQIKKINPKLTILDDTYNSNPLGFERALAKLASFPKRYQKIVVTPGMIELGREQFRLNREIAEKAGQIADIFVIVGRTNRRALLTGAKKTRSKIILMDREEALDEEIVKYLRPPTVILLENELPDHYF